MMKLVQGPGQTIYLSLMGIQHFVARMMKLVQGPGQTIYLSLMGIQLAFLLLVAIELVLLISNQRTQVGGRTRTDSSTGPSLAAACRSKTSRYKPRYS